MVNDINQNRITEQDAEYNKAMDDVILDKEEGQLEPSAYPEGERIYPMKSIKVDRGFFTAYELKRKFDKKPSLIILDSDFQRESVWKLQQKRELIESILMGLPLPMFYFNEDKKGRLIVIDGRQRLSAIFDFMNNSFVLDKLKILDDFNKLKFDDLDPIYQSKIEDYQIIAHVIQPETPDRIKFDIFDRVNRAGTQLNKQEIRNALYQGKATALLNDISKSKEFEEATEGYFKKDKRMKDRYLIIRFIAFYLYYNKKIYVDKDSKQTLYQYSGDIDEFLGITMDYLNSLSDDDIEYIKSVTLSALNQIIFYLGENAFRLIDINENGTLKRYPININIFETLMYGMTLLPYQNEEIRFDVRQRIDSLKKEEKFRISLNNHRDSEVKVNDRYEMIMEIAGDFND